MLRLTILLLLAGAAPAAAQPGDLDRSFGHGGRLAFAGGPSYTSASDVALDPSGRVLVAGSGQAKVGETWLAGSTLARLTAAGRIERRTFLSVPPRGAFFFNPASERVVALPDGGALVGATQDWQTQHPRIAIFRVRPDGTPDPGFGTAGAAIVGQDLNLTGIGVDNDGRIVLAATRASGDAAAVMRLLPDGSIDPAYGVVSLPGGAGALLVRRDGSAVATTTRRKAHARAAIHALDVDGRRIRTTRLTLHDTTGYQAGVTGLAAGPRGTLLVAGYDARRHVYGWVTRLRPDGQVDRRFGRRTIVSKHRDVYIDGMALDRHGRIVLAGARSLDDVPRTLVARLTPSGRRDRRFGPDGTVLLQIGSRAKTKLIASAAYALAIDARDRIVVAGAAYDDDAGIREDLGRSYFAVARLKG